MGFNIKITDDVLEKEGAWVEWQMADDVSVKMTRSTAPTIQKHLQMLLKKNRKALRSDKLQKEVMIKFMAQYVIVDWKGITNDDEPYEYTIENAITIMENVEDFYNWVLNESQNILNFAEDDDSSVEERGEELKK